MQHLFTLYRYLVQNQDRDDKDNPYTQALEALEPVLDLLKELDTWGENIEEYGLIEWGDAQTITHKIAEGHRTALCVFNGSVVNAITDFASQSLPLADYDKVIAALKEQQEQEEKLEEENSLGDLDSHPF